MDVQKLEVVDGQLCAVIGVPIPLPIELRIDSIEVDAAEDEYVIAYRVALPNGFAEPVEGERKQYLRGGVRFNRSGLCTYYDGDAREQVRTPEEAAKVVCELIAEASARDVSEFMLVGAIAAGASMEVG